MNHLYKVRQKSFVGSVLPKLRMNIQVKWLAIMKPSQNSRCHGLENEASKPERMMSYYGNYHAYVILEEAYGEARLLLLPPSIICRIESRAFIFR